MQVSWSVCFLVEHKQVNQNFNLKLEQHKNRDLRNTMLNLMVLEPQNKVAGKADSVLKATIRNYSLLNIWSTICAYFLPWSCKLPHP